MLFVYILAGIFFYKKLHFDTATFQTWSRIYPTLFLHGGTCYYDLKERVGSIFYKKLHFNAATL